MMSSSEENPTTESAKTITAINKDTVHKICSGQVKINIQISYTKFVFSTKTTHKIKKKTCNVIIIWEMVFLCMLV